MTIVIGERMLFMVKRVTGRQPGVGKTSLADNDSNPLRVENCGF
jgi:hypothetical protein